MNNIGEQIDLLEKGYIQILKIQDKKEEESENLELCKDLLLEINKTFKILSKTDSKEKIDYMRRLNPIKKHLESLLLQMKDIKKNTDIYDFSMAIINKKTFGSINLLSHTIEKLHNIMENFGFSIIDSAQIEDPRNNFDNLNISQGHPCRSDHDTFFLKSGNILRTQVTAAEVLILKNFNCPVAMYSIGTVFRNDNDATHLPMFHQIEGLYTYEDANIPTMFGFLENLIKQFLETENIQFRYRTNYFPFTSPSFEMDVFFNNRWLEILGCGMLHKNVFQRCNSKIPKGFAFGIGVERLLMIKYNINDIRYLYNHSENIVDSMGVSNFFYDI